MAKLLFVIAQKNYRDEELDVPKQILTDEGHSIEVASITANVCKGMLGGSANPNLTVKQALKKEYDGIVIVGGSGSPDLADDADVIELVRKQDAKQRLLAAICLGPVVLARTEVLRGVKATVWHSSSYMRYVDILKEHGAKFTTEKVVVDRHTITAFGPDDAEGFAEEIQTYLEDNA